MKRPGKLGFTLVEVVLALGICSFTLVAMVGLFGLGLKDSRESQDHFQAANLASQILAARAASPTQDAPNSNPAIPAAALTAPYGNAYGNASLRYIDADGKLLPTATGAAYSIVCSTGTNAFTGPNLAQVYLMLSWPPQATLNNSAGKYETVTYIPLQ